LKVLGIDPGGTTGWAMIEVSKRQIKLGLFGQTKDKTLVEIADYIKEADVIVYEGFWLRPDKARAGHFDWAINSAEQVIGSLMTLCKLYQKSKVVKQQPSQRLPGYGFSGQTYKKGKQGTHWQDALAHACFYAVSKLQALPVSAHEPTS
jgi:hypothetical protein